MFFAKPNPEAYQIVTDGGRYALRRTVRFFKRESYLYLNFSPNVPGSTHWVDLDHIFITSGNIWRADRTEVEQRRQRLLGGMVCE